MSDVVFILGAGASRKCGVPLMFDFLDTASRLQSIKNIDGADKEFSLVFEAISALTSVHSKAQLDTNNIESVFTALEMARLLGKLPSFDPKRIDQAITSLKKLIVITIERTMQFQVNNRTITAPDPYDRFAALMKHITSAAHPTYTASVITFNYDIGIDVGFHEVGLGPYYGFGSKKKSIDLNLYKLHGSLNWGLGKDNKTVHALELKDFFTKYQFGNFFYDDNPQPMFLQIGSKIAEYMNTVTGVEVAGEPVIIPPSWNKVAYHQTLEQVWAGAAKELGEAKYIFVSGYSLPETDSFFKLLYALGSAGPHPLKKFVVFDPDSSGQTESRFRKMLGPGAEARFKYEKSNFDEALSKIKGYFA